jgi:hypothetical protein
MVSREVSEWNEKIRGETHQHAVVAMFVKENQAGLRRHGDLLGGGAPIVREEDGLTTGASGVIPAGGAGGEVEEEGPCCLAWNRRGCRISWVGWDGHQVRVVIWKSTVFLRQRLSRCTVTSQTGVYGGGAASPSQLPSQRRTSRLVRQKVGSSKMIPEQLRDSTPRKTAGHVDKRVGRRRCSASSKVASDFSPRRNSDLWSILRG